MPGEMAATLGTLQIAKRLEAAGMAQRAAETLAELLQEREVASREAVATKADIESLRSETKADIELLRAEIKADIELLRSETKADIDALRVSTRADLERVEGRLEGKIVEAKFDLLKWIAPLMAAQLLALAGLYFK